MIGLVVDFAGPSPIRRKNASIMHDGLGRRRGRECWNGEAFSISKATGVAVGVSTAVDSLSKKYSPKVSANYSTGRLFGSRCDTINMK